MKNCDDCPVWCCIIACPEVNEMLSQIDQELEAEGV